MPKRSDGFPARLLVTALVFICSMVTGLAAASHHAIAQPSGAIAHSATSATASATPAAQTTGFVGDETCATCHETEDKGLRKSLHGKSQDGRTPAAKEGRSCETCHGPGQAHVDSGDKAKIKRFTALSARDANDVCLSCHAKGRAHTEWQGSMHDARNVSCVSCHSVHSFKSEKAQLKTASSIQTCESCHKQEAMKVKKSGHMPLREGKMECTSCHSPHGSTNVRMLKTGNSVNEACATCHAEKRGPFLWEHSAGRENCVSCHDPHGSNNDRMLVAKAPMLCQRCHISSRHPATIYDTTQLTAASNRLVGRSCVNCHSQIHGSNSPAGNLFLR
jgi:DmsE family decaheme c-type cytochrome